MVPGAVVEGELGVEVVVLEVVVLEEVEVEAGRADDVVVAAGAARR